MKVAATLEFAQDEGRVEATWSAHRDYLRTLLESGILLAAGPPRDHSGALWVLDVDTVEETDEIVRSNSLVACMP